MYPKFPGKNLSWPNVCRGHAKSEGAAVSVAGPFKGNLQEHSGACRLISQRLGGYVSVLVLRCPGKRRERVN